MTTDLPPNRITTGTRALGAGVLGAFVGWFAGQFSHAQGYGGACALLLALVFGPMFAGLVFRGSAWIPWAAGVAFNLCAVAGSSAAQRAFYRSHNFDLAKQDREDLPIVASVAAIAFALSAGAFLGRLIRNAARKS